MLNSCIYSITVTELLLCIRQKVAWIITFGGGGQELTNEKRKIEKKSILKIMVKDSKSDEKYKPKDPKIK